MAQGATAAVLTAPKAFETREFALPETGDDDGLLRIEAGGLCGTDVEQYHGRFPVYPIIPGHEIVGRIMRVGRTAAARWRVREGDRVVVESTISCGHCFHCAIGHPLQCAGRMSYGLSRGTEAAPALWGGYATHVYLHPATLLHKVPDAIDADVMSLFNPLSNAVRWVYELPQTVLGETVVICGPGQRGILAALAAREIGAGAVIVTGTARDTARLALARKLGASHTICVDEEDPVARVREITAGRGADVVLDVSAGAVEPIVQAVDMVRTGGRIVLAGIKNGRPVSNLDTDQIALREIRIIGAFSSGWTSIEHAIDIIGRRAAELKAICSHSYPVADAEKAVRVLAREIVDGPEAVHVTLIDQPT